MASLIPDKKDVMILLSEDEHNAGLLSPEEVTSIQKLIKIM